ncbi:MAG: extracellular solute-binding protein [Gemmatimonadales bacterium]|nr:extracellular solute-binding protein [Gemmatimonadales bacterium]NIN13357.1 extracellular solute-binding protein [Gemmatimonadales bacterium]NIN51360.1 extracellular solute-binding protein [Gemmatimonadales bacterium]NIP08824.1 extracellular solute-binding protein [Gemmatimonadales bacterium]NIQ99818.1 extracellular solute-binding protein [Gemmatimonadales bacterium]
MPTLASGAAIAVNDRRHELSLLPSFPRSVRQPADLPIRRWALVVVAAAAAASSACSDGRTPLVIYSPHGRELLSLAEQQFEAANPQVDVRWLDMGSQDALDRVRSERANPQADVWFGGPSALFRRAAAESLLAAYRPSWADAIPLRGHGAGELYFAVYETPAVIAYNSDAVTAETAPADWDDVLEPRWTGKVIIRDPLASGTMRTIFGMLVQRGLAATGDTAAGFGWLRRLDAQTREYVFNPALLHQKLLRQEGWVTLWDLPDILVEQGKGAPFDFVLPKSGTPVIEDAIAIVRGTEHQEAARWFVEWVGTAEAQLMAARQAFRLPARVDLPEDSLPKWARDVRAGLVVAEMDWELLSERGSHWMAYWDRNVRGRGRAATGR